MLVVIYCYKHLVCVTQQKAGLLEMVKMRHTDILSFFFLFLLKVCLSHIGADTVQALYLLSHFCMSIFSVLFILLDCRTHPKKPQMTDQRSRPELVWRSPVEC